ncbi:MAG: redoxin family protein [Pyrinomonadaceae bacterium]
MISLQRREEDLSTKEYETARKKHRNFFLSFRISSWINLPLVSALLICFVFIFAESSAAQTRKSKVPAKNPQTASNLPKVTQIDAAGLKKLLVPNGKPLLVNFWATWCVPCQEEYPDLVKINNEYKGKIDFITVSLDDLVEITRDVPKFLAETKAEMPAYLLKTPDEEAAIAEVSKDWQGGLPFTIFYNAQGEIVYSKQGKIAPDFLRAEIEKNIGK